MPDSTSQVIITPPALASFSLTNDSFYQRLRGKIILRVENKGQAYYISPQEKMAYYLGRPHDAFSVMRTQALGFTNANLDKLPLGLKALTGLDTDQDGLPDAFEQAIGTDKAKADTDADGFNDKDEIAAGYSPREKVKKLVFDNALIKKFIGRILLQVQGKGEAWYIYPVDLKRYYLSRPADAFAIMRQLGLGISEKNYAIMGGK